jgi:hypothetical protein
MQKLTVNSFFAEWEYRVSSWRLCTGVLWGMLLGGCLLTHPVLADITPQQVESSIRRGVQYLQKSQLAGGGWEEYPRHDGGLTALCTLAQLTAGVPANDPSVRRAMEYLRKREPRDTYSVSLQTLVYCQVGAVEDRARIERNVRWLEKFQIPAGSDRGVPGTWTYGEELIAGDPSNAQFALLALSAAEERGVAVNKKVFEVALQFWTNRQNTDGSWPYSSSLGPSGSMTCAGIASIIICRGHLQSGSSRVEGDTIVCCGNQLTDDRIQRGLDWLGNAFTVRANPGTRHYLFYYLYALERVGRLSGRRFIGGRDWYREGATFLVDHQDAFSGGWVGSGPVEDRNVSTSFALLFLAKGKRQVVLGRLQHGEGEDWQRHAEGPRQLIRHLEKDWRRDLTWQTVQLQGATVPDLLQTPVILISGQQPLNFSAKDKELLKEYVEQGGFLLFEATAGDGCGSPEPFARSVQAFCQEVFAGSLERLPPAHPVWYAERKVDPTDLGEGFWVYGLQTCCRTGVAFVPRSLNCRWELNDPTGRIQYSPAAQKQLNAGTWLGQNIIAYATGRELKDKLELRSVLEPSQTVSASARGVVTLARLAIDAGGEDARRAIPNLARYIARDIPLRIATESPFVAADQAPLQDFPLCWLQGRRSFQFSDTEVAALREYLARGGILMVDSICGDASFTEAVRRELPRLVQGATWENIPANHPMLTNAYGGYDISRVELRMPTTGAASGSLTIDKRNTAPVLEAIRQDGRIAILFSPYDLSCALESQNSIQCPGYSSEDAAKIGINMLLFMLLQ